MSFPSAYEVQIQRFANALYNLQVGSDTMAQVVSDIQTLGSPDAAFNYYFDYLNGLQTTSQVTETLLANFGIVDGQYGLDATEVGYARDYILGALNAAPAANRGAVVSDIADAFASLANDAIYGAAATAWNAEITIAVDYVGSADLVAGTEIPSLELDFISLTVGNDVLGATNDDDTFMADVMQNSNGAQVNSLGTGDYLNGFAGTDTLEAQVTEGAFVGGGNSPIQPRTFSVEEIKLEALFSNVGFEAFDLNFTSLSEDALDLIGLPQSLLSIMNDTDVYVDAGDMDGVDFIGSDHSDADLTIQDLTTEDAGEIRLTSAMTIGMAYTGNSDHVWDESDLRVYFDEDYLLAGQTVTESEGFYWLLDEIAWDVINGNIVAPASHVGLDNDDLLWRNDRFGVTFTLDPQGADGPYIVEVTIGNVVDADYTVANDHPTFVAMLNTELAAMALRDPALFPESPYLANLSFTLDPSNPRTTSTDSGDIATVPAIVLTDAAGGALTDLGFSRDDGATGYFDVFGDVGNVPSEDVNLLISVNVELEKAGRGGDGGELIIGGMNKGVDNIWGEGSSTKPAGVEQFDVTVIGTDLLPNSLAAMHSTNNALQVINIDSIDNTVEDGAADLQIGNSNTVGGLDIFVANFDSAIKDVQTIDASAFLGDLTIYAGITEEAIAKYLNLVDTLPEPEDDNVLFNYVSGVGNDSINVQIDSDVAAHEDFEFSIDSGAGDDSVVVAIMGGEDNTTGLADANEDQFENWYWDQLLLENLSIDTGTGDDVVWVPGSGDWIINLGTGDDVVYTDNTGNIDPVRNFNTYGPYSAFMYNTWDFSQNTNQINEAETDWNDIYRFYNATVTVEFMGHEVTVDLDNDSDGLVTDLDINQAIINAVNSDANSADFVSPSDDPGLSAVLSARQGMGYTLIIESLIDGDVPAPTITINTPTSLTAAEILSLSTAYGTANTEAAVLAAMNADLASFIIGADYLARVANDGNGNDIVGSESLHNSDNVIEGDLGDDVFVLGTNASNSSNDTLVYEGYGNGFDCVYNFVAMEEIITVENLATVGSYVQGAAAAAAGGFVAETFTLEVTAGTGVNNVAGSITFDGGQVDIPLDATLAQVVAAFLAPVVPFATYTTSAGPTASTIIFTETTPAGVDIADSTHQVDDFVVGDPTIAGVLVGTLDGVDGATTIPAVVAATESFVVTFGNSTNDVTYTFDGEEIPVLDGETGVNIANAAAVGDYANWTAVLGPGANQVTFTSTTADTNVADVTDASFVGANIVVSTFGLPLGFDMIDYTAYDVTAVVVNDVVVLGALVNGSNYIWLDEENDDSSVNDSTTEEGLNLGEYEVTERTYSTGGDYELDTEVGIVGIIDFGNSMDFSPSNFII